mgnify:FL=1
MNRTTNTIEGHTQKRLLFLRIGLIAAFVALLFILPSVKPVLKQAFAQETAPQTGIPLSPPGGDDPQDQPGGRP